MYFPAHHVFEDLLYSILVSCRYFTTLFFLVLTAIVYSRCRSHHTGGLIYYSSATHGWYLQSWGSGPARVPPAAELGTRRPPSDFLPLVSSKQF